VSKLSTLLRKINQNNLSLSNFSVVCGAGRTLLPLFPFFSRPKAGRFCRGELWSVSLSNCVRPPAIIVPPAIIGPPVFWGFGAIFGLFGRTRCAPTGFWGYLGAGNAPLRVFGGLGARDAPLRVLGEFGLFGRTRCAPTGFGRTRRQKPPHQVNLDAFREKFFLHRESLQ
jgi:hypothetical protein